MPNRWKIFAQRTKALEDRFYPKVKRIIKEFRAEFTRDMKAHGVHIARSRLNQASTFDTLSPLISSIYKSAGLMGARLQASELKEMAGRKGAGFGRNERWIQSVIDYLKLHLLEFTQDITETMKDDILRILSKAIEEGMGVDEIAKRLSEIGLPEARARVITRTEIIRAANVGHSIAARDTPYEVDKQWIAANDHRTRHSHVLANGLTVSENDTFAVPIFEREIQVGTDDMQFPGDPTAHPSNTINCRCRAIYIPKRDANGRLVMREENRATIIPIRRPRQIPIEQIAATLKENVHIGVEK
jgi:hypothetical protein